VPEGRASGYLLALQTGAQADIGGRLDKEAR
jgi:hypothetical protein